ncbi:MAG: BrnT family toxin [Chloroflexi bacterium]|nr:BrnT family toxin [Chloroflexota bacterium]
MNVTQKVEDIDFEWDSEKADANLKKHGVSFTEACEVFFDPFVYLLEPKEVDEEEREAVIGLTKKWTLLYVAYIWRKLAIRPYLSPQGH